MSLLELLKAMKPPLILPMGSRLMPRSRARVGVAQTHRFSDFLQALGKPSLPIWADPCLAHQGAWVAAEVIFEVPAYCSACWSFCESSQALRSTQLCASFSAGAADGLEKTLPGFIAGVVVQVKVTPYNDGGDEPESPVAQVT